jgi:L-rhamnose-H+ transport protein
MDSSLVVGFAFLFAGAVCNGLFASPSNYVKKFPWENLWGLAFFLTMIILPLVVFPFLIDKPLETFRYVWQQDGAFPVLAPLFFGALWGTGFVLFAVVISNIGFSLTFAIVYGLMAMFGSLIPLLGFHIDKVPTTGGMVVLLGILLCTIGVAAVGYAGMLRNRPQSNISEQPSAGPGIFKILILCILTGFFCACPNLAFAFGGQISKASHEVFGNP